MTTQASVQRQRRTLSALASTLCVVSLAASACATADDDAAMVEIGAPTTHETANNPGELEYGESIVDLVPAIDTASADEPVDSTLPGFRSVEWEDLIPPGFSGDQILDRYQDRLDAAEPGSPELDALYEEMNAEYDDASVNPQLDSEDIQLAGFVAPLTYDGDDITEFLLVPYFGACIHVPPPPANQTVMVTLAEGESLSLEESWGAVWVAGKMIATTTDTDLATAGYSIAATAFGVYETQ